MHATTGPTSGAHAIGRERVAYTIDGAAEQLSLSVRKVKALIKSGELQSVKFGRARRVLGASIEAYATSNSAAAS